MTRPTRRRYSYPLSLALVVAFLVTLTGGWMSWWNYRSGRDNATASAGRLFDQVALEIAHEAGAFLDRAPPASNALRGLAELDPPDVTSDALARRMLAVLRANPTFSWVTESDSRGTFSGAYRPSEGGLRVNQSHITDGKTVLDEHDVGSDGAWTPGRHEDDSKYDPRERPYYKQAAAARRAVWTPPYAFAMPRKPDLSPGDRVPGITYAQPLIAADDGAVRGMLTIDFDLAHLSELVRTLNVSAHGRAVILAEDDTVIAHPTELLVAPGEDGALLKAQQLADPALRALVQGGTARDSFDTDGTPYLARDEIVPLPGGPTWRVLVYAPESDFTGELMKHVMSSLMVSLVGLVLAVLLAWLLARRVSGPLITLAAEMGEVGDFRLGEPDAGARHSMFREIQTMIDALAKMKGGLRSFARYVPRDLVRAVLASGQDASLSGEVRQLTVYFSDLAGFTTLAESKAPDELVRFLGEYLDDMSTIIAGEKGTVDKYLGDGIMAFWGAPSPLGDHAARACTAALRCQKRLAEYAARGTPLHTRIGVATGDVLVGNIGSSERMNYTVMGDTANLASRLESLNKQFGTSLMISEPTYEAAKALIVARPLDIVAVKGKSRGVRVYELLALASDKDAAAETLAADATAALDAYLARDWPAAIAACDRILARAATAGDKPTQLLRARAAGFAETPPPPEWSGVNVATEK